MNLCFAGDVLPVDGFGYLVPTWEKSNVLGVVFDSCAFPRQGATNANADCSNTTRLTVMIGGHQFHTLFPDGKVLRYCFVVMCADVVAMCGGIRRAGMVERCARGLRSPYLTSWCSRQLFAGSTMPAFSA